MNSNDVALKLDAQMTLKMPKALLDGLQRIKDSHGTEPAEVLRRLAEAAVQFHQQHGFFTFPVKVEPEAGFLERAMQYKTDSAIAGAKREAEAKEKPKRKTA